MDNQSTPTTQESIFNDVLDLRPYEKSLSNARIWLYIIAGLQFAVGIYEYFSIEDNLSAGISFGIDAFIGLAFLVLAIWSKQKPFIAFTLALVLYIMVSLLVIYFEPTAIVRGIIFKVLIIVALVKAINKAKRYEEIKSAIK